ncbi:MAG: flavodoxin family protein [bacterium]
MHHIGIFYYSLTGTTEEFANVIAKALINEKNHIEIAKIKTNVKVTAPYQKFEILDLPDCSKYDFILIGGPVWAFSICPVVAEFIKKSKGLANKKVIPFITMGLPFSFFGGNQALKQMSRLIKENGGVALSGVVVMKLFHKINEMMEKKAMQVISMTKTT